MQKSNIPVGVKTLKSWADKETLRFDHPVQRSSGQWNLIQKSLLIHSMLANYPIPPIYLIKSKDENGDTVYSAIECKQRLTSVFEFIGEEGFAMHASTPSVTIDGFEHDLADMRFEDLADELRDEILGYRFSVCCLEDCTEEEVEEIFTRLNNSTPLSPIQKCRSIMGSDLARWTKEICASDFFQHSVNLTLAQVRREADLETLLQSMLLLDSRDGDYDSWNAISTSEVTKYCKHIRGNYSDEKKLVIMEIVDYLYRAFPAQHKFLKKSNIPTVIVLAKLALENDISTEEFCKFINYFSNAICPEFEVNTGSGNIKRVKTEGRLLAIAEVFANDFALEEVNILYARESDTGYGSAESAFASTDIADTDDVGPTESENAALSDDENSELNEESLSVDDAAEVIDETSVETSEEVSDSEGSDDE